MKYLLLILLVSGCGPTVTYGPDIFEEAIIYDTIYMPAGHSDGLALSYNTQGVTQVGGISIDSPARYAVVFECQHGKFVIDGRRGRELYEKLSKGDKVKVKYRLIIHDDKFHDFDFLEAYKQ